MAFNPIYPGPIEGWTVNYCKQHFWRVERSMEWADLMQESYIVFLRCLAKYPDLETPQHFMALYKRAWCHELNDLAEKDTRLRVMVQESSLNHEDDGPAYEATGELQNDGHLAILLKEAPSEVLAVLNLFLSAPTELVEMALDGWTGRDRRTTTKGSSKICRMLGLNPDLDVLQLVEDYLTPA